MSSEAEIDNYEQEKSRLTSEVSENVKNQGKFEASVKAVEEEGSMSFKPDYGLKLLNDGISRNVDHCFYDFRLYSLTVLGRGEYSTMVEMPFDGKGYAMSLDFSQHHLDKILSKGTKNISLHLKSELSRDPSTPRSIELDGEVVFDVRARLGELQRAQKESFVPFVAQEIM
jgi:hypothetical protein